MHKGTYSGLKGGLYSGLSTGLSTGLSKGLYSGLPGFCPEYKNVLWKAIQLGALLPPRRVQLAQSSFILDLQINGLYSRMKSGYFFHSGSVNFGRVNIKDPSRYTLTSATDGTAGSTILFLEGMGAKSDGHSYYSQPFFNGEYSGIATDLTQIQYISEDSTDTLNQYSCGMFTGSSNYMVLAPKTGASNGTAYHYVSTSHSFTNSNHKGLYVQTYDGTNSVVYKDGVKNSTAKSPIAPVTNTINRYILCYHEGSPFDVPSSFYTKYVAADFLFDRFSDADELLFRTIFNRYKNLINLP